MYQLVLFDLDGTLVDTAPDIADAVNDWLAEQKLAPVTQEEVRDRIGHGTRELLVQVFGQASGTPPELLREEATLQKMMQSFFPHFLAHAGKRSRVFPGARECLVHARRSGIYTVLITNKEQRATKPLLEAHDLDRLFDLVLCGDSLAARKPHPLPVMHSLGTFNVPPSRALLIGDSDIDIQTARNAGIAVWAVPHGYNAGRPVAGADRVLPDFAAIQAALLEANSGPPPLRTGTDGAHV